MLIPIGYKTNRRKIGYQFSAVARRIRINDTIYGMTFVSLILVPIQKTTVGSCLLPTVVKFDPFAG